MLFFPFPAWITYVLKMCSSMEKIFLSCFLSLIYYCFLLPVFLLQGCTGRIIETRSLFQLCTIKIGTVGVRWGVGEGVLSKGSRIFEESIFVFVKMFVAEDYLMLRGCVAMNSGNGRFRGKEAQLYSAAGKAQINAGFCVGICVE